jgi:hypothetical protein
MDGRFQLWIAPDSAMSNGSAPLGPDAVPVPVPVDKADDVVTILRKLVASATDATTKRGPENG